MTYAELIFGDPAKQKKMIMDLEVAKAQREGYTVVIIDVKED